MGLRRYREGAVLEGLHRAVDGGIAGHEDHRHVEIELPHRLQELDTALAGHLDVRQDDVVRSGGEEAERLLRRRGGIHLDMRVAQQHGHGVAQQVVVVHQQEAHDRSSQAISKT